MLLFGVLEYILFIKHFLLFIFETKYKNFLVDVKSSSFPADIIFTLRLWPIATSITEILKNMKLYKVI